MCIFAPLAFQIAKCCMWFPESENSKVMILHICSRNEYVLCWLVHYEHDLLFAGANAVLMFMSDTIPVIESAESAHVCVELDGLAGPESLGCAVRVTLDIQEGSLASMVLHV